MPRFVSLLVACLVTGVSATALAQTRVVTGNVSDTDTGEPLVGAQIAVKANPTIGTMARDNGSFTLTVPAQDVVLVVRRIGYPMKEVAVPASMSSITISMRKDVLKLDQIVVTGQASTVSRRNLANSVASVDAEDLTKVPAVSIEHALQGKGAGAQIQPNTGAPGGGNRVRLRGTSSILGNATPLYVVDGVITSDVGIAAGTNRITKAAGAGVSPPTHGNPLDRVARPKPPDIREHDGVEGAAAAAIYGSKGARGGIMITTKRGRVGSRAEFLASLSVSTARR